MFISQTTDFHFANYRFSFRKLQIFISQTTDFHFANYRFSFRKLQIFISQTTDSRFANYRFPFRKLQISISQTTDFHFANYRFPFRFVPFRFVPFRFVPFRFANYSKPNFSCENQRKNDQRIYIEKRRSGTKWLSAMFDAFASYNFSHAMRQMQYPVMFLLLCSLTAYRKVVVQKSSGVFSFVFSCFKSFHIEYFGLSHNRRNNLPEAEKR